MEREYSFLFLFSYFYHNRLKYAIVECNTSKGQHPVSKIDACFRTLYCDNREATQAYILFIGHYLSVVASAFSQNFEDL